MYRPTEIIFAPTGRCNLDCAHCRVSRDRGELGAAQAVAFLRDCVRQGSRLEGGQAVERVGFSGGEPFLRPDFLVEVAKAVVDEGLLFDRLMTNGVWYADEDSLKAILGDLADAGFDGMLGLSVDDWHGQDPAALALFLESHFATFGRRDIAEIVCVRGDDGRPPLALLSGLAGRLGGRLESEEGQPTAIVDAVPASEEALASGSALHLRIVCLSRSPAAGEDAWKAEVWFEDDRCEGPGQALYVHPDGQVAVCCGFANERPELSLGHIEEGLEVLLARAAERPLVQTCYGEGLSAFREGLAKAGVGFPGVAGDQCFFCDWVCARGLAGGVKTS
jgi:hypothetical protein